MRRLWLTSFYQFVGFEYSVLLANVLLRWSTYRYITYCNNFLKAADHFHTSASRSAFLLIRLEDPPRTCGCNLGATPSFFLVSHTFNRCVGLNIRRDETLLKKGYTSAVFASAIHDFVIFCTVYQINFAGKYAGD